MELAWILFFILRPFPDKQSGVLPHFQLTTLQFLYPLISYNFAQSCQLENQNFIQMHKMIWLEREINKTHKCQNEIHSASVGCIKSVGCINTYSSAFSNVLLSYCPPVHIGLHKYAWLKGLNNLFPHIVECSDNTDQLFFLRSSPSGVPCLNRND